MSCQSMHCKMHFNFWFDQPGKLFCLINQSDSSYLERMSLLVLVDSGEDGLVDAEAHGGRHQRQGEVSNHADKERH